MERLTKRSTDTIHENGVCCTHFNGAECRERQGMCTDNCPWEEAAWSRLAAYEDAEEEGRLVVLPCKVGDVVSVARSMVDPIFLLTGKVTSFIISSDGTYGVAAAEYDQRRPEIWDIQKFGKTIFLTREEAEAALKEGR